MLVSTAFEVANLGALLPFLSALAAPEKVLQYPVGSYAAEIIGVTEPDELLLPLTILFCTTAILASFWRVLLVWSAARLSYSIGHDLAVDIYRRTLYQPYIVHTTRNTSEILSTVAKVKPATASLMALLNLISSALVVFFIAGALFLVDPVVTLFVALGLVLIYLIFTILTRRRLRLYGEQVASQQTHRLKAMQEGLGAIRDVLLNDDQPTYSRLFRAANLTLARARSRIIFLSQSPRFVVEGLGMVAIASIAYALSQQTGGFVAAIPLLGAFALGAQRMLPSLQQIYSAWATMRAGYASLDDVLALVRQPLSDEYAYSADTPLAFGKSIEFRGVHFAYDNSDRPVLQNVNLTIPKGATVGFVGATGSGKSTVVDLLMGLLDPTSGQILVDGTPLDKSNRRAWRRNIAHVPQAIFLIDDSLAQNIAFGVPPQSIDLDLVERVAKAAHISDLASAAPAGYASGTGERGVRLSGGQRQRIAIARALYKQASVLVFDEATSALDRVTEQGVMEEVQRHGRNMTVILVAHRVSTLRGCDHIFMLEAGQVSAVGTYDELIKGNQSFRRMASDGSG